MEQYSDLKLSHVGLIDNHRRSIPWATLFLSLILIAVSVWFIRGGTYKFYTSLFFGLYFLTHQTWVSIILVGVVQSFIFLPLRIISSRHHSDLKDFESELAKTKNDNQYILFRKNVTEGSLPVIFYSLNFVLLTIAFVSVGRVFLLDFYNEKVSPHYLYSFIPYPEYPLNGTVFNFPFFKITQTISLNWSTILYFWLIVFAFYISLRLVWIFLRFFLTKNKKILQIRIKYNRTLIFFGSFIGTLFLFSIIFLRHIPTGFQSIWLSADLAKQNTVFNIITAFGMFFAATHAGYIHQRDAAIEAKKNNIPDEIIAIVFKNHMYITLRNGIFLAGLALWVTRLMPSSHDLSVLTFIVLYLISPITFDLLIPKKPHGKV